MREAITAASALRYTRDEVSAALAALTKADISRLMQLAARMAAIVGMDAQDLFQESYVRVLDSRTCERGIDMASFLRGTMRSIASEGPRARKKAREECGLEVVYLGTYGDPGLAEPKSDAVPVDEAALARVDWGLIWTKVEDCIADDFELQLLVEGLVEGQRGADLEALLGTDVKALAAARRRLTNRLNAAFPNGWPLDGK